MKKSCIALISIAALLCSCNNKENGKHNPPPPGDTFYTVTFNLDSDTLYLELEVKENEHIDQSIVLDPVPEQGYSFVGWYKDEYKLDFDTYVVTSDVTFLAKFEEDVPHTDLFTILRNLPIYESEKETAKNKYHSFEIVTSIYSQDKIWTKDSDGNWTSEDQYPYSYDTYKTKGGIEHPSLELLKKQSVSTWALQFKVISDDNNFSFDQGSEVLDDEPWIKNPETLYYNTFDSLFLWNSSFFMGYANYLSLKNNELEIPQLVLNQMVVDLYADEGIITINLREHEGDNPKYSHGNKLFEISKYDVTYEDYILTQSNVRFSIYDNITENSMVEHYYSISIDEGGVKYA